MKDYLDESDFIFIYEHIKSLYQIINSVNWRINNLTTPALLIAMRTPLLNLVITSYYLLYQIKQRDAHLKSNFK
ncbi:unnamed protein product [Rhizophagus irregularis]|nr:unnamed protein product [Rhizophagus irregularis]